MAPMTDTGVWAVISTFRPGASALAAVTSVQEQVDGVIVVDDGSGEASAAALERLRDLGAHVSASAENLGIAASLNRGIREARARGARHVLTLDQDSEVPAGFVERLLAGSAAVVDEWLGVAVP